jgi:hypothetical protein
MGTAFPLADPSISPQLPGSRVTGNLPYQDSTSPLKRVYQELRPRLICSFWQATRTASSNGSATRSFISVFLVYLIWFFGRVRCEAADLLTIFDDSQLSGMR